MKANSILMQILIPISILLTIITNAIIEIIPLNGATSGDISDFYPSLFTPPGYVFSIWSVIYTLLIITAIYQVRPSQRDMPYLKWTSVFYVIGGIINVSWLVVFHFGYTNLALFLMTPLLIFGFLAIGLFTYVKLGIGIQQVPLSEKLAIHLPISVYVGWVSLASIANTASVLNAAIPGIDLATQEIWTAAVIIIALIITALMLLMRRDFAYGLVVVWATVGIGLKQMASAIISAAAFGTAVVVLVLIVLIPIIKKMNPVDYYLLRTA